MEEEKRTIGYLCPACRKPVIQQRTRFALMASGAVIACECGESALTIEPDGVGLRLRVPCGACGGEHNSTCAADAAFTGEGIALACPETQELCCFLGSENAVARAMEQLAVSAAKDAAEGETFLDNVIMYEVLSELREIAARPHGISCTCGSERYAMEIRRSYIDLVCKDCGARYRIPAATDADLDDLCCRMTLQIKGGGK